MPVPWPLIRWMHSRVGPSLSITSFRIVSLGLRTGTSLSWDTCSTGALTRMTIDIGVVETALYVPSAIAANFCFFSFSLQNYFRKNTLKTFTMYAVCAPIHLSKYRLYRSCAFLPLSRLPVIRCVYIFFIVASAGLWLEHPPRLVSGTKPMMVED